MKSAEHWLNQVGETVMQSALAGANPPGCETEKLIRAIQADALRYALDLMERSDKETTRLRLDNRLEIAELVSYLEK